MASLNRQICKLCLKTILYDNYKTLDGDNRLILEVLLLQMVIKCSEQCVICMDCMEMLQKCFEFKSCCLDVEDYISPFIKNGSKIDIGWTLQKKGGIIVDGNTKLCRLCIDIVKDDICKHLDQSENRNIMDDIRNCLPELNINAVHNPLICEKCVNCLSEYRNFQKKCRDLNNSSEIRDQKSNLKDESIHLNQNFDDLGEDDLDLKDIEYEEERLLSTENGETLSEIQVTETNDMLNIVDGKTTASSSNMEHKDGAVENLSTNLRCLVLLTPLLESDISRFKTQRKASLQKPVLTRTNSSLTTVYECNNCLFKTRWKKSFKKHMLGHAEPSEIPMYECNICQFKTRWKVCLKSHTLGHADPSKMLMYECNACQFKTRWKPSLRRHKLIHTDSSKITMYECNICQLKTRWKLNLKRHMLGHSKKPQYECNICRFKTRWQSSLKTHMLRHAVRSDT